MARGISVESHRRIRAPAQRVWHLLSRLESLPRYATLWFSADVLERSPASALVEFRGFFGGLPLTSVQRLTLRAPVRVEFRQVRGELRELSGAYVLKEQEGDTDLVCQLAVDTGIPLFSDASVQQILAAHIDGTLARIKAAAERDLVRLAPRRPRPAEVASPIAEPTPPAVDSADVDGPPVEAPAARSPDVVPEADRRSVTPQRPGRRGRRRRRRGRRGGGTGAPPATP